MFEAGIRQYEEGEAYEFRECPVCRGGSDGKISRGDLTLQINPPTATFRGVELKLGPAEFRLLELVVRRRAVPWSTLENIVPASAEAGPGVVGVTLCSVRRKLKQIDPVGKTLIRSVRGWGLKLAAE
jgi:DNA-binding response OmpR family regulator